MLTFAGYLNEAYSNYKKTIGTFNTLVTKKDYENFIYMFINFIIYIMMYNFIIR